MSTVLICLIASDLYAMIPFLTPVSVQKICWFTRFVINCRFVVLSIRPLIKGEKNRQENRHPYYQCSVYEFRHFTSLWSIKSWWRFGMEFKVFLNFESHAKVCSATTKLAWGITALTFEGLKFKWQAGFLWFIKSQLEKDGINDKLQGIKGKIAWGHPAKEFFSSISKYWEKCPSFSDRR